MSTDSKRLFFALWPDDTVRTRIAAAVPASLRSGEGRPVGRDNLHMTLAFLHSVPVATLPCVVDAAARCRGERFVVTLDHFGYWRRSRMLWLGTDAAPPALGALVDTLWEALAVCGFEPEKRAFHPHVTLARRIAPSRRRLPPLAIDWPVDGFALVESITGGHRSHYDVIGRWPLAAPAES